MRNGLNVLFILFLNMLSDSLWKKEKSFLEDEASSISVLKKEITKQTQIDASVQLSINDKIEKLKQNATLLAKKLENEKHKNMELDTIIKHMKGRIDQERLEDASFRDNNNSDNLNSLQNKFKKLEYDLGQMNGKVNRMSQNLQQKRSKVSQNRTERVIDSGIFRNIEKELIDSELTFKKLLIEKIRYQKDYQKKVQEYNSLKQKAENYYVRKNSMRTKTTKDLIPEITIQEPIEMKKKFLEVEIRRNNHSRYTAQLKIDQDISQLEEKQVLRIKKLLVETNLESCSELLHYFEHIDDINDKYFNEINIYTDQSNQIEKYLANYNSNKKHRKGKFTKEKSDPTKNQIALIDFKNKEIKLNELKNTLEEETKEIITFVTADTFSSFLESMGIQPEVYIEGNSIDFDKLSETLKLLDKTASEYMKEPTHIEEENKTGRNGSEKLDDLINKVRKSEECMKVMKKQDFKEQYHKLMKVGSQKGQVGRSVHKKKSFPSIKK